MTVVGFTGTRVGMTEAQRRTVASLLVDMAVPHGRAGVKLEGHHGDCIGADTHFHALLKQVGATVTVHPPEDNVLRAYCDGDATTVLEPAPYLVRNRAIVDAVEIVIATPKERREPKPGRGQGTWSTVRYARKRNKPLILVWPDGTASP